MSEQDGLARRGRAVALAAVVVAACAVVATGAGAAEVDLDLELREGVIDFGGSHEIELPEDETSLVGTWDDETGAVDAELITPVQTHIISTGQFGNVPVELDLGTLEITGTMDPDGGEVDLEMTLEITLEVAFQPGPCTIGPVVVNLQSSDPGYPWRPGDEAVGLYAEDLVVGGTDCDAPGDPHDLVASLANDRFGLPTSDGEVLLLFGTEPPPPDPTTTTTTAPPPIVDPDDPSAPGAPGDPGPAPGTPGEPGVGADVDPAVLVTPAADARAVRAAPSFTG